MPDPKDAQEYLELFKKNSNVTGFGIGNVYQHMPCPFCAAAEWKVYEILQVQTSMQEEATCKECGRSAKAIVTSLPEGGVRFEVVQTGGSDQPDWLQPKMRRI